MDNELMKVDGKFYKKCKVVMLTTENKSNSLRGYSDRSLLFNYQKEYKELPNNVEDGLVNNFHLYFLSNEEIKEGDWFMDLLKGIHQATSKTAKSSSDCKIIATTDSLRIGSFMGYDTESGEDMSDLLPRPSDSFIQKYVEEYNKGNVIKEVLVEYEQQKVLYNGYKNQPKEVFGFVATYEHSYELRVAPDSTITIKSIDLLKKTPKESGLYTTSEVIDFIKQYAKECTDQPWFVTDEEWIQKTFKLK